MIHNKFSKWVQVATLGALLSTTALQANAVTLPPGTKLADKQVLGYRLSSTPESLDPSINVDWNNQQIIKSLFDTLVRQDNTGKYIGAGAQSWSTSKDGLTWTFKLRKNATWTDGKPVKASEYVYAWQRVLDPKTASLGADYFVSTHIKNAEQIRDGKLPPSSLGVKALDDYTLQISLAQPTPWLLDTLTFPNTAPLRKDVIDKYGTSWTRPEHIVSNGPFYLAEIKFNEVLRFAKRADYWDAKHVYITDINYIVQPDSNSTYYSYLAGEFYTTRIPAQFVDIVKKERPKEIIKEAYPSTYSLVLNTHLDKFKDKRVRQAINLLLDRKVISEKVYKAYIPTSIIAPTILQDGNKQVEDQFVLSPKYTQARINKAVSLLKAAGYSTTKPLTLEWLYQKTRDGDRNNLALMGMLKDFSGGIIQIKHKVLETNSYYNALQKGNFEIANYIMNPDYYHVSSFFNVFVGNNANNFSGWSNPKFSELYKKAYLETNVNKRKEIYQEMNKILQDEVPVIPYLLSERFILRSPALGGFNGKLPVTYLQDYYIIADKKIAPVR